MASGYKIIEVMVRDDDYETLLRAQAAFRRAIDTPCQTATINASNMKRAAEAIAVPALCSAVEIHEREDH